MKEVLYTIPVNDAFNSACECPICSMMDSLEQDAITFTMGPSYMEDDIRLQTDQTGFCNKHIRMMYANQNRLGLALMLSTHLKKTHKQILKLQKNGSASGGLFRKKESSSLSAYTEKLSHSCFVCNRIQPMFERYLLTVFHLYENDESFRQKFKNSKGFCTTHYGILYDMASDQLGGSVMKDFINDLNQCYESNMERMITDLDWFIDKFDYRNTNEPWKNSKDALPRTITKTNSVTDLE